MKCFASLTASSQVKLSVLNYYFSAAGNGSFSSSFDIGDMQATSTSSTSAALAQQQANEGIYLWIPLIVVIIFAVIITTLIVIGRQTQHPICKCLGASPSLEPTPSNNTAVDARPNLHVNINLQINARDTAVPETPPPSYAVIARQISYISTISQTSSQLEIPPGYDEALGIADGTGEFRTKRRGSQQLSNRGSVSSLAQLSKSNGASRMQLSSRSSSVTESPRRPTILRQSSNPAVPEVIHENLDPQVPQASLNVNALDVIHEATGSPDDTQSSQIGDERSSPIFYIDETNNGDSHM